MGLMGEGEVEKDAQQEGHRDALAHPEQGAHGVSLSLGQLQGRGDELGPVGAQGGLDLGSSRRSVLRFRALDGPKLDDQLPVETQVPLELRGAS